MRRPARPGALAVALAAATVLAPGCAERRSPATGAEATATGAPSTGAAAAPAEAAARAGAAAAPAARSPAAHLARARDLARDLVIVDGHVDLPYRLEDTLRPDGSPGEDVAARTAGGDFDWPRAVEGGLDAPFMSIYVPAALAGQRGKARAKADQLIDRVERIIAAAPDRFAAARSPDDVLASSARGLVSLPLGIENGSALETLADVRHFFDRGVRYVTLTHSKANAICDSSYDAARPWKGLSPYGREVVAELNRVGIMIDVSHVSDDAFRQAVERSAVPVIASHSSARHFTPGFERNPSDELIRLLAGKGGVIMINFGSTFIDDAARRYWDAAKDARDAFARPRKLAPDHAEVKAFEAGWAAEHPPVRATVADVADHIDHVVRLVGVDHVGLGSDFDGVGPTLPTGLSDVSMYPNLFAELLARGYLEGDLAKIASGNVFRVWRAAEAHAAAAARTAPSP